MLLPVPLASFFINFQVDIPSKGDCSNPRFDRVALPEKRLTKLVLIPPGCDTIAVNQLESLHLSECGALRLLARDESPFQIEQAQGAFRDEARSISVYTGPEIHAVPRAGLLVMVITL